MYKFQILKYYSQPKVQEKMIESAKNREVVGSNEDGSFFKRPDTLLYPRDVLEKVKRGAVAFHCSVERWDQPMQLSTNLSRKELDDLRIGWDFILDIDCKIKLEHAKIAAGIVCDFLKDYNVEATTKFSGSRGIHLAIASQAFPKKIDFRPVTERYPEMPQALVSFVREKTNDQLLDALIKEEGGVAALVKSLKETPSQLSPFSFVDFEKNWGARHLFRMQYSLHPKTWLVSVPIRDVKKFEIQQAKPQNVKFDLKFLANREGEATELAIDALEWFGKQKSPQQEKAERKIVSIKKYVPESLFPNCVKSILSGISDGRKRSIFTLVGFLRSVNWSQEEIEKRINEWNKDNKPPLRDVLLRTQLKWHLRQSRKIMPANCNSDLFYHSIGVCKPDHNCKNLKNPVNYAFKLFKKKNK